LWNTRSVNRLGILHRVRCLLWLLIPMLWLSWIGLLLEILLLRRRIISDRMSNLRWARSLLL
jgi:hypothetical protein